MELPFITCWRRKRRSEARNSLGILFLLIFVLRFRPISPLPSFVIFPFYAFGFLSLPPNLPILIAITWWLHRFPFISSAVPWIFSRCTVYHIFTPLISSKLIIQLTRYWRWIYLSDFASLKSANLPHHTLPTFALLPLNQPRSFIFAFPLCVSFPPFPIIFCLAFAQLESNLWMASYPVCFSVNLVTSYARNICYLLPLVPENYA